MARTATALHLRGVRQTFTRAFGIAPRTVLDDIDLELPAGATLGLVGPNGSGKTTLVRILAGVDDASAGTVEVLGGTTAQSAVRRRIGFLPEDSPFPPELGALSALHLLGSLQGLRGRELTDRATTMLERVGLGDRRTTRLGRFSRGMLRRFGLAQAWLHEPDLLLLDEPTAGLDAPGYGVLESLLGEAAERGTTVVLASHAIGDLRAHCDRLVVVLGGRIAADGSPHELLTDPTRRSIELRGLDAETLHELRAWVEEHGGTVAGDRAGDRTLLELYRDATEGPR